MKKTAKKALALLLCLVTVFGTLSITVSAQDSNYKAITEYEQGDLIEFGWYPQTQVTNSTTISKLNDKAPAWDKWTSYGYYSGRGNNDDGYMTAKDYMRYVDVILGDNKYRGVRFTEYRPASTGGTCSASNSEQYDNGYYTNNTYWFVYEPLRWRVLNPETGLVLCDSIIDSQPYNNYQVKLTKNATTGYYGDLSGTFYANDYTQSSIRNWINTDFLNSAFGEEQRTNRIKSSWRIYNNAYSFEVTNLLFLIPYGWLQQYGFASNSDIRAKGSDYAKCQGLYVASNGYSGWSTLYTDKNNSGKIPAADAYGAYTTQYTASNTSLGIRPILYLNTYHEICQPNSPVIKGNLEGNVSWVRDLIPDVLRISGKGKITADPLIFCEDGDIWFGSAKHIIIEEGITGISNHVFLCDSDSRTESIVIPSTMRKIGLDSVYLSGVSRIEYGGTLFQWYTMRFYDNIFVNFDDKDNKVMIVNGKPLSSDQFKRLRNMTAVSYWFLAIFAHFLIWFDI